MDQLIESLLRLLESVLDGVRVVASGMLSFFATPASWLGVPPEVLAAVLLALLFVAGWRSITTAIR